MATSEEALEAIEGVLASVRFGGTVTAGPNFAYVLAERRVRNNSDSYLAVWDVSEGARPRRVANPRVADTSEGLVPGNFYNSPFREYRIHVRFEK